MKGNKKFLLEGAPLLRNDYVEVDIDNLGINGEGIARVDGFTVFIKGALMGERVRAKIILVKPTFAIGKMEKIISTSPDRVKAPCRYFNVCGGCSLQHLSYSAQLIYKANTIKETFKKVAGIEFEIAKTVPSPKQYGYRNKVSLPVRGVEAKPCLFEKGSHKPVAIEECIIQKDWCKNLIKIMTEYMQQHKLTAYDENTCKGDIRHIVVREVDGTIISSIVSTRTSLPHLKPLQDCLFEELSKPTELYLNFNDKSGNAIMGKTLFAASGEILQNAVGEAPIKGGENTEKKTLEKNKKPLEFIPLAPSVKQVAGLKVSVHPESFFQVNDEIRDMIYCEVLNEITDGEKVMDAYCGAGILTGQIAKKYPKCKLTGIELVAEAIADAEFMKKENGLNNLSFYVGDCGEMIKKVGESFKADVIILDPPRRGAASAISAVNESHAKKIIYISCNPSTLARDLLGLTNYDLISVTPYDMFPNTSEVEVLAVLKKKQFAKQ